MPGQPVDRARAQAAADEGDWSEAAMLWNELFLRGGEERVLACRETARALIELGDLESARGVLELGLRRDPGHPALLEMQGDVLARMGFRRAAEAAYVQALDAEPDRPHALLELARIRIDLGREHLALEALRKRLALGAVDAETYLLRARALAACNQPEQAYSSFVKAFELGADDPLFLLSAACLSFDERLQASPECRQQSIEWLQLAVESDPQLTLAHLYLGVMCEEAGQQEQALEHYERAVETDPSHGPALTRLAQMLETLGHGERAAAIATRALEYEQEPGQRARLKRLAGR
jgi:tetratricopeptide (TPR) repeat protein